MTITSRDNQWMKDYRRLAGNARCRRESGRFVLEGARLVVDAVRSQIPLKAAFFTARAKEQYPGAVTQLCGAADVFFEISESLAAFLAETQAPQGLFAIATLPPLCPMADRLSETGRYAALEQVQDPGNLGAIIRTAEAFGLSGLLLSDGCCDVYSPKVLRASMGGVFRLPLYAAGELSATLARLAREGLHPAACVVEGAVPVQRAALGAGSIAVIGNEGNGLRPETVAACPLRVTIPMAGRAESLNASMAAGIVFWEMVRERGARDA